MSPELGIAITVILGLIAYIWIDKKNRDDKRDEKDVQGVLAEKVSHLERAIDELKHTVEKAKSDLFGTIANHRDNIDRRFERIYDEIRNKHE